MNDDRELFAKDWQRLLNHLEKEPSDLVLLPEMPFSSWFSATPTFDPEVWNQAVHDHEQWISRLYELSVPVVMATRPIEVENHRINQGFAWSKRTGPRAVHTKSYLPNEAGYFEASWYEPGERVFAPFDVNGMAKAGLMICSDMWAMQHARAYGREGAHLIAVPYAASNKSIDKWLAGGRVAAVVSGAYCVASNRVGPSRGGEVEFGGSGWVIDPDGKVLGMTSGESPFVTVQVDTSLAENAKNTYPRDVLRPD